MPVQHAPSGDIASIDVRRRRLIGALGAAALPAPIASMLAPAGSAMAQTGGDRRGFTIREDRFTRIFPDLPSFAPSSPALVEALMEIGRPGGMMDAKDPLEKGPAALIVDLSLSANNRNNPTHTAGVTFMGQFMDHDVTFDLGSKLAVATDPAAAQNERTPAFDLDSVYGGGPIRSPELYAPRRGREGRGHGGPGIRFRIESGGLFEDLPRDANGRALLGDPRNDENILLAGLHAAMLKFHNAVVDHLRARHPRHDDDDLFLEAHRLVLWHYQWLIVNEFLPLFVGRDVVDDVLGRGRRFYVPPRGAMPVEFQGAAYRFGHSMVRPSYRANLAGDNGQPFFGLVFDPSQQGAADPSDMRGGVRAKRRFVGWQTFFDFGDGQVRPNKRIDPTLSTPLFNLPVQTLAVPGGPLSLPQRNLLRHITWQLPSGQAIARRMNVPALSTGDLTELAGLGVPLDRSTPLFYYVLKEAQVINDGLRLGPVGGRIVAEVILGLLQLHRSSYLAADPLWRPTLPDRFDRLTDDFRMVDLLAFAGVDPASRGQ